MVNLTLRMKKSNNFSLSGVLPGQYGSRAMDVMLQLWTLVLKIPLSLWFMPFSLSYKKSKLLTGKKPDSKYFCQSERSHINLSEVHFCMSASSSVAILTALTHRCIYLWVWRFKYHAICVHIVTSKHWDRTVLYCYGFFIYFEVNSKPERHKMLNFCETFFF